MGTPSIDDQAFLDYVLRDQVLLAEPGQDAFLAIAREMLNEISRTFSEAGMAELGDGIRVPTTDLTQRQRKIRAEPFLGLKKDDDLHEFFVDPHGDLHEVVIDVDYKHRKPEGESRWYYYPVTYVGIVQPTRLLELYDEGYTRGQSLANPIGNFLDATDILIRKKEEKAESRLKALQATRTKVKSIQSQVEKARLRRLREKHLRIRSRL